MLLVIIECLAFRLECRSLCRLSTKRQHSDMKEQTCSLYRRCMSRLSFSSSRTCVRSFSVMSIRAAISSSMRFCSAYSSVSRDSAVFSAELRLSFSVVRVVIVWSLSCN